MMNAKDESVATETLRQVLERFYEAERTYMQSGQGAPAAFAALQATLAAGVVLNQRPGLTFPVTRGIASGPMR